MKYWRVYSEVFRKPWAILPEKLRVIGELLQLRAAGGRLSDEEIAARLAGSALAAEKKTFRTIGTVAVIPIFGVIAHRMDMFTEVSGGTSIERLTARFREALNDPGVKAIVFDVDSPGGSVEGVPELAAQIFAARGKKQMIAVANTMAASAAYWLASRAGELAVTPSGEVGSIGVFAAHEDWSRNLENAGVKVSLISAGKFKTEGNPYEPLSEEARAALQADVDKFYEMFVQDVSRGRAARPAAVRSGFGQGRMVLAADAVAQGMADRVATLDQTLARLGAAPPPASEKSAAGIEPVPAAIEQRLRELDLLYP